MSKIRELLNKLLCWADPEGENLNCFFPEIFCRQIQSEVQSDHASLICPSALVWEVWLCMFFSPTKNSPPPLLREAFPYQSEFILNDWEVECRCHFKEWVVVEKKQLFFGGDQQTKVCALIMLLLQESNSSKCWISSWLDYYKNKQTNKAVLGRWKMGRVGAGKQRRLDSEPVTPNLTL